MTIKLFKFRSMNTHDEIRHTLDILENKRLYCALPSSFNDPFECLANISFVASDEIKNKCAIVHISKLQPELSESEATQKAHLWWQQLEQNGADRVISIARNNFRVCSFSARKPDDILMWSHYAGGHNGICLEYSLTQEEQCEFFASAMVVNYQDALPDVNFYTSSNKDKMHAYVLTKSARWNYEKERRIILNVQEEEPYVSVPPGALSTVILGACISEENRRLVLDRIASHADTGIVRLMQAKISPQAYELVFSLGHAIMRITLDKNDVDRANELAQSTYEKWKNARGHYTNTPNSHRKGKLGEIAVKKWMESKTLPVDAAFVDMTRDREADLKINATRVEVKTWAKEGWPSLGRCLAVGQMKSLQKKADVVVWCYLEEESDTAATVVIAGWSNISDIEQAPIHHTGRAGRRQVENHQLDEDDLRSPDTLLSKLG